MTQNPESPAPPAPVPAAAKPAWWRSDAAFLAALALVTLGLAWGMARVELDLRARHAYLEGEKYYGWYLDPSRKKAALDAELASGKVNADQYQLLMQDNDLKNAYVWYDTVLELFQPPRGVWVLKSEARMKEVKPKYDAWLRSLSITPVD